MCFRARARKRLGKGPAAALPCTPSGRAAAQPDSGFEGGQELPRRAPPGDEPLAATLTVRLTAAERQAFAQRAEAAGMTPSRYAAEVLRNGRIVVQQHETLAPALMAELSRIGNNLNQLAHAANAGMPADARGAIRIMQELFTFLMRDEITRRRVEAFAGAREASNDSQAPQARHEFQGSVRVPVSR